MIVWVGLRFQVLAALRAIQLRPSAILGCINASSKNKTSESKYNIQPRALALIIMEILFVSNKKIEVKSRK
jgi:hypothetical protein